MTENKVDKVQQALIKHILQIWETILKQNQTVTSRIIINLLLIPVHSHAGLMREK